MMDIDKYNLDVLNKIDLFFQLFNNMSDLVYLTKVDGNKQFSYILANEPAKKFSGLTSQSFGKPLNKVLPLEVFKKIEAKYLLALTTKETITYEDEFFVSPTLPNLDDMKYTANQVVYWESMITPVMNQDGRCTHLLAVVRDITDRKEKENELKRMNDQFELVWNSVADAMYIFDRNENFVSVNKSFETLLGWKEEEIKKDPTISIIPKGSKEDLNAIIEKVKNGEVVPSHEVQRVTKNGQLIYVLASYSPIYDRAGNWDGAVVVYKDITERKKYEEQLKYMAHFDQLTGLPNRSYFLKILEEEMGRQSRLHETFAVCCLDIDRFKEVNDTYGHDIGDELLKEFTKRVKSCIRKDDTLARMGGDEFFLLIRDLTEKTVLEIADRIVASLQNEWVFENIQIKISSSIGIAFYSQDKQDEKTLLKQADIALYQAKQNGRGHYQIYQN